MPVLKELGELDHADDGDDQRQPHGVADWADLQLPVKDECEDSRPIRRSTPVVAVMVETLTRSPPGRPVPDIGRTAGDFPSGGHR